MVKVRQHRSTGDGGLSVTALMSENDDLYITLKLGFILSYDIIHIVKEWCLIKL